MQIYRRHFATAKGEFTMDGSLIVDAVFAGAPTASAPGFVKMARWVDTTNGLEYRNTGSTTSATWVLIGYSGGTLASATITALVYGTLNDGTTTQTASALELNRNNTASGREVLAGASLAVTQALHDGKTIAMPAVCAITLPAATGSGSRFRFYQKIAATAVTITATAADMYGVAWALSDNSAAVIAYTAAGSTILTYDGSTKGGVKGAIVEIEDVATSLLLVRSMSAASGSEVTPFS